MKDKELEEVTLPKWKLKVIYLFSFAMGAGAVYLVQYLYSLV